MKKWNAPEVAELNINETADGIFTSLQENCLQDCICGNDDNHSFCDHFKSDNSTEPTSGK